MPKLSKISDKTLSTCDERLQVLFRSVIEEADFTVICGYRGEKEQNEAFDRGNSKLRFPKSNHNVTPSLAVDVAPYPIDWTDEKGFQDFAKVVKAHAQKLGIEVSWGGDWKSFKDLPHYEVKPC